jgi:catechol 2,3-dioxygenase-like lactoylglutathione lyase family enzyme
MLVKVDHIDLKVPDLEEAADFFKGIGMVEVRRTNPARRSVELALPGDNQVLFEIREDKSLEKTVIDHVAFSVDSTAATLDELKSVGVTFSREGHLVVDTGRRVSNFQDPRGGKWQLSE